MKKFKGPCAPLPRQFMYSNSPKYGFDCPCGLILGSALQTGRNRAHVPYVTSIETSQIQEEVKAMVCDSLLKTTVRIQSFTQRTNEQTYNHWNISYFTTQRGKPASGKKPLLSQLNK